MRHGPFHIHANIESMENSDPPTLPPRSPYRLSTLVVGCGVSFFGSVALGSWTCHRLFRGSSSLARLSQLPAKKEGVHMEMAPAAIKAFLLGTCISLSAVGVTGLWVQEYLNVYSVKDLVSRMKLMAAESDDGGAVVSAAKGIASKMEWMKVLGASAAVPDDDVARDLEVYFEEVLLGKEESSLTDEQRIRVRAWLSSQEGAEFGEQTKLQAKVERIRNSEAMKWLRSKLLGYLDTNEQDLTKWMDEQLQNAEPGAADSSNDDDSVVNRF